MPYASKEAQKEYQNRWVRKRRDWLDRYKVLKGCSICGYKKHAVALDFHHRDPAEKIERITQMVTWAKVKIKAEVAKCDVVCANCHRTLDIEE